MHKFQLNFIILCLYDTFGPGKTPKHKNLNFSVISATVYGTLTLNTGFFFFGKFWQAQAIFLRIWASLNFRYTNHH